MYPVKKHLSGGDVVFQINAALVWIGIAAFVIGAVVFFPNKRKRK